MDEGRTTHGDLQAIGVGDDSNEQGENRRKTIQMEIVSQQLETGNIIAKSDQISSLPPDFLSSFSGKSPGILHISYLSSSCYKYLEFFRKKIPPPLASILSPRDRR
ncbi:MAG: hypothetical protein ACI4Q0_05200, partial [Oligosphaeraceae bacterium]